MNVYTAFSLNLHFFFIFIFLTWISKSTGVKLQVFGAGFSWDFMWLYQHKLAHNFFFLGGGTNEN